MLTLEEYDRDAVVGRVKLALLDEILAHGPSTVEDAYRRLGVRPADPAVGPKVVLELKREGKIRRVDVVHSGLPSRKRGWQGRWAW